MPGSVFETFVGYGPDGDDHHGLPRIPALAKFAAHIECFWHHSSVEPVRDYRVLPDGCSDIIFEQPARDYGGLAIVGTMTRAQTFDIPARQSTFGVRFRPGMAPRLLRVPGSLAVDRSIPLTDAWKSAAVRELLEQLGESNSKRNSPRASIALIEAALAAPAPLDPFEKALACLAEARGQISIDALAYAASLSPRQFRRICLDRYRPHAQAPRAHSALPPRCHPARKKAAAIGPTISRSHAATTTRRTSSTSSANCQALRRNSRIVAISPLS